MAKIIKKISTKTVFGDVVLADLPEKESKELIRVVGIATGTQVGMSTYGEWTALKGSFQAINLDTGEEYRSNKCFVPDTITDGVAVALAQDNTKSVEFGVLVSVRRNPNVAKGYEYEVEPLLKMSESDPLESLVKRLDAPKEQTKEEVATEKTAAKKGK
jgi:hypothetical protein